MSPKIPELDSSLLKIVVNISDSIIPYQSTLNVNSIPFWRQKSSSRQKFGTIRFGTVRSNVRFVKKSMRVLFIDSSIILWKFFITYIFLTMWLIVAVYVVVFGSAELWPLVWNLEEMVIEAADLGSVFEKFDLPWVIVVDV